MFDDARADAQSEAAGAAAGAAAPEDAAFAFVPPAEEYTTDAGVEAGVPCTDAGKPQMRRRVLLVLLGLVLTPAQMHCDARCCSALPRTARFGLSGDP